MFRPQSPSKLTMIGGDHNTKLAEMIVPAERAKAAIAEQTAALDVRKPLSHRSLNKPRGKEGGGGVCVCVCECVREAILMGCASVPFRNSRGVVGHHWCPLSLAWTISWFGSNLPHLC